MDSIIKDLIGLDEKYGYGPLNCFLYFESFFFDVKTSLENKEYSLFEKIPFSGFMKYG